MTKKDLKWIVLSLLLAQPLFVWLGWRHYRDEPLKEITAWPPSPDRNEENLS